MVILKKAVNYSWVDLAMASIKRRKIENHHAQQTLLFYISNRIKCALVWCCDNTSLHGLHYVSNKNSSIFTRLFFASAICSSFILCSFLIWLQFVEYQEQPVLTTIGSTAYPVWKLRFPSVTVCNFNIVYKDNAKHLFNVIKKSNIKEELYDDMLYNLSALIILDELGDVSKYKSIFEAYEKAGYTVNKFMAEVAHPCASMIKQCFWQSREVMCSHIFETVKTNQGFCCGFNYYGTSDRIDNMDDPARLRYLYVGGAGHNLGLKLVLDVEESQYVSSIKSSYGINVLVQDGFDYPDMDLIANTVSPNEDLTISVYPQIYDSNDRIKNMDYKHRDCLFSEEGNLVWSAIYSYPTCITQCRVEAIEYFCKCVPYFYPVKRSGRVCTLLDVPCLRSNQKKYNALEIADTPLAPNDRQKMIYKETEKVVQCECYPECDEQTFSYHTDRAKATPMVGFEDINVSVVNIYYNTIGCVKTDKDVYFTWDRVIASIGGIFGLCLGGSIISILECLYFLGRSLSHCKNVEPKSKSMKPSQSQMQPIDTKLCHYGNNVLQRNNYGVRMLGTGFKTDRFPYYN